MSGRRTTWIRGMAALAVIAGTVGATAAQQVGKRKLGYDDTPMLPGEPYRVHDGTRPQPPVVTPGVASTQEKAGTAPSDAIVLFDGKDASKWKGRGPDGAATCKVEDGAMVIGGGDVSTRDEFGDCQFHIEFATPNPPSGIDQGRGNSGVMFFGRYEIQVLDCYENLTYPDGQTAAIYGQYPPMVNASRPPGQWQTYDIIFTAPRFTASGELESPAYVTMLHNGVLVHDHAPVMGAVAFRGLASYSQHGPKGPIVLQDHGNPVRFRNIWVREIQANGTK